MPRKRMVDPQLWDDEDVGRLTLAARLLWIALFSLADDEGRGKASAARLARAVFGFDADVDAKRLTGLLAEITAVMPATSVCFYVVAGKEYYALLNWDDYQRVDHPTPSKIPPPPATTAPILASIPVPLVEDSPKTPARLGRLGRLVSLGKVSLEEDRLGEALPAQIRPPPPPPLPLDLAFGEVTKLLESERIITQYSKTLMDDVGDVWALLPTLETWRKAVLRVKSRDPARGNWALMKKILLDYERTKCWDVPGYKNNGYGSPGRKSASRETHYDEAELVAERARQALDKTPWERPTDLL